MIFPWPIGLGKRKYFLWLKRSVKYPLFPQAIGVKFLFKVQIQPRYKKDLRTKVFTKNKNIVGFIA
ncbi:hypothetical protein A2X44_00835 [candidate division CPR3 bacterium GWF2_35_18]|nr:MAG: hypothetical protein A2X44_00835 [candidate division CPR3 bacterium GWF2_35_18]OGB64803.1 MAG: hypothetical protein A2250_05190 [candidate division CPR3 bacterium RIFOXYA2_FULL_35_13]OGB77191.1 MAG: hypothetical protein A2476_03730 [candidate division CPR3 bacterium RIFOXYC2_FULL_35_7]OGB78569.1 MAG: hypothetical protein A2296_01440 [candidate division CPR3 bacterium RIFOXYB2_FULL_35_8]